MKHEIIFTVVGLIIFLICFTSSVKLRDHFYEQSLINNIQKIKVGMSEDEVIKILGKPSSREMSDIPGEYWCYDTDSIGRTFDVQSEVRCGHLLLEMSSPRNSRVVKIIGFRN